MTNTKKKAQSLIEYGLILALVAVIAVTILGKFSKTISGVGNTSANTLNTSSNTALQNACTDGGGAWAPAVAPATIGTCTPAGG